MRILNVDLTGGHSLRGPQPSRRSYSNCNTNHKDLEERMSTSIMHYHYHIIICCSCCMSHRSCSICNTNHKDLEEKISKKQEVVNIPHLSISGGLDIFEYLIQQQSIVEHTCCGSGHAVKHPFAPIAGHDVGQMRLLGGKGVRFHPRLAAKWSRRSQLLERENGKCPMQCTIKS